MDERCTAHFRLYCPASDCITEHEQKAASARHPITSLISSAAKTSRDGSR